MAKPAPLKGKGHAMYDGSADAVRMHFTEEDVREAVEWLKDAINSDLLLKSCIVCTAENMIFDKIDQAFPDVMQPKPQEKKKR